MSFVIIVGESFDLFASLSHLFLIKMGGFGSRDGRILWRFTMMAIFELFEYREILEHSRIFFLLCLVCGIC